MTPYVATSLQQVLTDALSPGCGPVDGLLRRYFRDHPSLGRRDRGDIAETVFDVLRNRRLYASLAQSGQGRSERRLMLLSWGRRGLLGTGGCAAGPSAAGPRSGTGRFEPLGAAERSWLDRTARIDAASLPPAVAFSLPDWLFERLLQAWGDDAARAIARSLLQPAPLDLRVNLLKADREQAIAALRADGIDARPLALAGTALRVDGKPALERSSAFEAGLVEVQDAGSQVLALLAAPRRGQTVIDFCAGAGGKTLALAALMRSTGQIFACDVSAARLARLRPRLARAGASNVQPFAIDRETDPKLDRLAGRADLVLVDAPCSGTGTLRRNPDLKWRLQEHEIVELRARQLAILRAAARLVKPGGALVYATCSLLPDENEAVASDFESVCESAAAPGGARFVRGPVSELLAHAGADIGPVHDPRSLVLRPDLHGCDGFFAVRWTRTRT
jgi:16S rRNA (cytosine967-C5)-methyltransferase